jgi:hypothetical protein
MIWDVHPGSRIQIQIFFPSRIPDPGVKALDPGSAILLAGSYILFIPFEVKL